MKVLALFQLLKALACVGGVALVAFYHLKDNGRLSTPGRGANVILGLLALFSIFAYFDFGKYPKHGSFLNPHDHFHYHLGAKYSKELGYVDLYRAVVVANTENNGRLMHSSARSLDTYDIEQARTIMRNSAKYKEKFTPDRWEEFKADVAYFQDITKPSRWPGVVRDKGYNATPVWNMVAALLTNHVASTTPGGMFFLMSLDLILLSATFVMTGLAFGPRVAALLMLYFGAHLCMSFPHIRGAFLRMDWVTFLAMGTCCLKLNRHKTAAALFAYAAMARIFPLIFVFGFGAKMLWSIAKERRVARKYWEFFVVFFIVMAALLGASIAYDGGTQHWKDFVTKIGLHDNDLSPTRVGFKYIFIDSYKQTGRGWTEFETRKVREFEESQTTWWAIQAAVLLITFFAARKLEDYETVPLGYVPAFFLTAPTFYYHVMLIVPFLLFAPKLADTKRAIGAALMFGLCTAWYALLTVWSMNIEYCYVMSCTLLALCAYMVYASIVARVQENPPLPRPSASETTGTTR